MTQTILLQEVRLVTLHQPSASLMAENFKLIETRPGKITWNRYRGLVAIHAGQENHAKSPIQTTKMWQDAQGLPQELEEFAMEAYKLPVGCIVAIGMMVDSRIMSERDDVEGEINISSVSRLERCLGEWSPGRKAIIFENIVKLPQHIPFKGMQGLISLTKANPEIAEHLKVFWQEKMPNSSCGG